MKTSEVKAIVNDIRRLYELMTPVDVIARTLHLPERIVRHAIEVGTLPHLPEPIRWKHSSDRIEA